MSRIVWTNAEKAIVSQALCDIFQLDPKASNMDALRRAQLQLPKDRRLNINHGRVFTHKARIENARSKARTVVHVQPQKRPEERPEPAPAMSAPAPVPERKGDPTTRLVDILELLLDVIAVRVATRVADHLNPPDKGEVHAAINRAFDAEHARHNPLPLEESKCMGLPGVLIIGLLPAQQTVVRHIYAHRLDLAFLSSNNAVSRPALRRAHTVLMTKFINHSIQEKYRQAPMLHFCNGGTSELCKILDKVS